MIYRHIKLLYRSINKHSTREVSTQIKEIGPGGYALLVIPITTFCLGTWQIKRRKWKLNLIDEVQKQHRSPPVELPHDLEQLSEMEYRRVNVHGKFDHSKELYIGPRQLITNSEQQGGKIFSIRPLSGMLVVTPFYIPDRNITILVNRGWVSKDKANPSLRGEGQIKDEIDLVGTVRLPEKRPQFSAKNKEGSRHFFYRDVGTMAQLTGAEPVFIDADADSTVAEGPIGGQTRITFRNEHLSYIFTWYSLSIATSYMWYRKFLKSSKFPV